MVPRHPLFRSENMSLYQIFIQYDSTYETTVNLGEYGIVEVTDLHLLGGFHTRQFSLEIEICDDIERRLDAIQKELVKEKYQIRKLKTEPPAPYSYAIFDMEPDPVVNEVKLSFTEWKICAFQRARHADKRAFPLSEEGNGKPPHSSFYLVKPLEVQTSLSAVDLNNRSLKLEKELKGFGRSFYSTKKDLLKYSEYKHVMLKTEPLFEQATERLSQLIDDSSGVGFITGVISREKVNVLQSVIWRICQGNVFFSYTDISGKMEDPDTGNEVFKCVFYAIFQGDVLEHKVLKVCEGYKANIYNCPQEAQERISAMNEINSAITDLQQILEEAENQRKTILILAAKNIERWQVMIKKAKATYNVMNKFQPDKSRKVFIAEFWVPECNVEDLHAILNLNVQDNLLAPILVKIETDELPPTYHNLNKFTKVFQELVDAYGPNTYQEHNPAPYYIITFPFLFSIMFGDAGHGTLMALAAAFLIYKEREFTQNTPGGEIGRMFFSGRYIIVLMGLFSIYSGLMYNDAFSKEICIFRSSWIVARDIAHTATYSNYTVVNLNPKTDWKKTPYPLGLDPIWNMAHNGIVFRNSLKMKMSIILGVIHMLFGITRGAYNIINFKTYSDLITLFIPQIIFLSSLFLYLSFLIVFKWIAYGPISTESYRQGGCAPSILNIFIGMVLFTKAPVPEGCHATMFAYQEQVQLFLLICALICVPWLFLAKPILEIRLRSQEHKRIEDETSSILDEPHKFNHRRSSTRNYSFSTSEYYDFCQRFAQPKLHVSPIPPPRRLSLDSQERRRSSRASSIISGRNSISTIPVPIVINTRTEDSALDIFIHQSIHSIEFILGTVSNTASYLRLWALSLAHEQLSVVVWKQLFAVGLRQSNVYVQPFAIALLFVAWTVLSISILVLMEGLSAFLHTLRLHWIEFQSKFYDGNGRKFVPFSYKDIIRGA